MQFRIPVAMSYSTYAVLPAGKFYENLMLPNQEQDVGPVSQLTGNLQEVSGFFRALVSFSSPYRKLDNSFVGEVRGLSNAEPFRRLSPKEVDRLRLVQGLEKGWDGDAAEPVNAESIESALELLLALKSEHATAQDARVLPIADGRIQLEWHDADRSLEFEFTRPGWVAVGLDRSDRNAETKYYTVEFDQIDASTVSAAYDWFVRRDPKIAPWPSKRN
jgi:hypothetical protein